MMKSKNSLALLLSICTVLLLIASCKDDDNDEVCPAGYLGVNCELIDTTKIQALLDEGIAPKFLYDGGVTLMQLYGKMYEGDLIFYLDTIDGTGMVAATTNQSSETVWGCFGTDIIGLNNVPWNGGVPEGDGSEIGDGASNTDAILDMTNGCNEEGIAAKLCRDKGADWFLPSIKELNLMYTNLHLEGHGGFESGWYWSSTERDEFIAWDIDFQLGGQFVDGKDFDFYNVRAARAF